MRVRLLLTIITALSAAALLAACGGRSRSSEQTAAAGTPTVTPLVLLAQGLTLTGRVAGSLSEGTGECRSGQAATQLFQVTIAGEIAGARHSLRAVAESYTGPGSYGPDAPRRATFRLDAGAGSAGVLVVDDGGASGSMEVDLLDGQKISGTWMCTVVASG